MDDVTYWEWKGDPARTDGWTVIGDDEGQKRVLVSYDSFNGAASDDLGERVPGEWIMDRPKAEELHDRILEMDHVYWPGFNPTVARVEDGRVVEYVYPPDSSLASQRQED